MTYIVVLVDFVHSSLTLLFRDNFSRVFHDNLVRLEAPVAADSVSTVRCLDHLNANTVFPALISPSCEICKGTVRTVLLSNAAVAVVAFVEHNSILAIVPAAVFGLADTLGHVVIVGGLPPNILGVSNESV